MALLCPKYCNFAYFRQGQIPQGVSPGSHDRWMLSVRPQFSRHQTIYTSRSESNSHLPFCPFQCLFECLSVRQAKQVLHSSYTFLPPRFQILPSWCHKPFLLATVLQKTFIKDPDLQVDLLGAVVGSRGSAGAAGVAAGAGAAGAAAACEQTHNHQHCQKHCYELFHLGYSSSIFFRPPPLRKLHASSKRPPCSNRPQTDWAK